MTALTATYALASLLDAPPVWLPPISHCEIATTDGVWGVHAELDAATKAEAYRQARGVSGENGVELHDDGRTILVDVELTGVAFRFWWLRPVLRWHVPEQCATCPTKLGAPDVRFVRLGEGDREAPVICVPCRDRMHAAWVEQGEKDTRSLGESTPQPAEERIVAYRNTHRPGVLLCREHGDGWAWLTPLTSDDLPDGGICTHGDPADSDDVCGRDVLIDTQPAEPKLCPPCKRGDCDECMGPDRPPHLNPYRCPCNTGTRCPQTVPYDPADLGGYDFGIPGSDA